jgi:hypothetical protein
MRLVGCRTMSPPVSTGRLAAYPLTVVLLALTTAISVAGAAPPNNTMLDQQREPHTAIAIDLELLDSLCSTAIPKPAVDW